MVITVKVGQWANAANEKFAACLSTGITGAVGSYLPDGDVYAFYAKDIKNLGKSGDKHKPGSGNISAKFPSGKLYVGIQLIDCTLGAEVESTATEELNVLNAFINAKFDFGATRCYFWVKNTADNKYINLTRNSGKTNIRPLYGFPKDPLNWSSKSGEASIYRFPFIFEEVTIGS